MKRPWSWTSSKCLSVIMLLGLATLPAHAGSTVYSSLGDFEAALGTGSLSQIQQHTDFMLLPSTVDFSNGIYSYTVASVASSGLWGERLGTSDSVWIVSNAPDDTLLITFTGAPVSDVGGEFLATNVSGSPISGDSVTVTLNDGTTVSVPTGSDPADSFAGFIAPDGDFITSLSIGVPVESDFPTIADVCLGNGGDTTCDSYLETPEPATLMLMTAGLGALWSFRRKPALGK